MNTMNLRNLIETAIATMLLTVTAFAAPEPQTLFENSDFEQGTLKNWSSEGNAFKYQPTIGDNLSERSQPEGSKHQGDYWIGAYESYTGKSGKPGSTQGDRPIGRLTSSEFMIAHDYINFSLSGGSHQETSARLLVDGKTWLLASGRSNDAMTPVPVDMKVFRGKTAQLVLLDNDTVGWGHINAVIISPGRLSLSLRSSSR